jgi:hypothetical protein
VRSIRFPDVERGESFDPENTRQLVVVCAGPSDGPGEEYFCLEMCTPAALAELLTSQPVVVGRHLLFVAEFNVRLVEDFLPRAVQQVEGATWSEGAAKIGRLVVGVRGLPTLTSSDRYRYGGQPGEGVGKVGGHGQLWAMRSRVRRPLRVRRAATCRSRQRNFLGSALASSPCSSRAWSRRAGQCQPAPVPARRR